MRMDEKSKYWQSQKEHYEEDEEGNITIHEDAPEAVKKSYKQYQIEQSMMSFFVEEEEEIIVERSHELSEEQKQMVASFMEVEKKPQQQLKKDYSMFMWQKHHEYYEMKDGKICFHEDTPVEILKSYASYAKQQEKLKNMSKPQGFSFKKFLEIMAMGKRK